MTEEEAMEYLKNCLNDEYNFKNATRKKDKECYEIILNLIQKQDTEINKLNNVIDKLVKRIKYDTEWFYSELDNKSEEEIKESFMKEDK